MTEPDDQQPADGVQAGGGAARPAPIPPSPTLMSLSSGYVVEQHGTYLRHLQDAVNEPKNLNIALTGRYGTGKSSVLDEFVSQNETTTMRIAISTLGPDTDGKGLTNRIQKELVKQLLYRAIPSASRFSRFNRIVVLSRKRAVLEAAAAIVVVGAILAFVGLLPPVAWTGAGYPWIVRVLSWLGFAALATAVFATLRLFIYGRFLISDISAAGATVKLTKDSATYFDEYLEEIVYFFDRRPTDVVIFEDLDRFDVPQIFEAVRELNTLLNHTPKRVAKGKPLQFVYAVKDSLFERLGSETDQPSRDAAVDETVRANRTKFFDVVIPIVPFISHRNARELLDDLLKAKGFIGIDRALIALVAQHATDMRLLKNICNEYAVFAERLFVAGKTAPGLNPTNLFALVAYKNFHLKDFEDIARRKSDLDTLYAQHRRLVRTAIEACEQRKRDIVDGLVKFDTKETLAKKLGVRLAAIGLTFKEISGFGGYQCVQFSLDGDWYSQEEIQSSSFWIGAAQVSEVKFMAATASKGGQQGVVGSLVRGRIDEIFPELADAARWSEFDEGSADKEIARLDADIVILRGADFKDLAAATRFRLPADDGGETFAAIVETAVKSRMAKDLVKRGYLDRNFALYAAQFYGDFVGVGVATFLVQTVQTNSMDIDHEFKQVGDVENLLNEAPADFSRTVSAYNIDVLNYLLSHDDPRAEHIAGTVVENFGDEAQEFVRAYLNAGAERLRFVATLSQEPWPDVFTFLVGDEDIPSDVRPALVDVALRNTHSYGEYELGRPVRDFIIENYLSMQAFTTPQPALNTRKIIAMIKGLGIILPRLAGLDEAVRERIVEEQMYRLTADNLRDALGGTGDISIDRVLQNADVYDLCRKRPSDYLAAVAGDSGNTPHAVLTDTALAQVLKENAEAWDEGDTRELISMASPESRLVRLDSVPASCWGDLAANKLFASTVANVLAYRDSRGSFDQPLADLVLQAGSIDAGEEDADARAQAAVSMLNAADVVPDARRRVALAAELDHEQPVTVTDLAPESGDLLALLIQHGLVEDSLQSFSHFRSAGWDAVKSAIAQSKGFSEFMTPDLLDGFVPNLLGTSAIPRKVRDKIFGNLAQYVPGNDNNALAAAGRYAIDNERMLPLDQIRRVAAVTHDGNLVMQLLSAVTASPEDVVAVLSELGEPYSHLTIRGMAEFEVSFEEDCRKAFDTVFGDLKKAGLIADFRKQRSKNFFDVKLQ
ncbi:hypothetical protein AB0M83_36660 [Amycolatopsis sp. NPDC051106]|uniref:YobI family P-loop NTPase n=1 Tax=unclassified Amycolatopsis TaxID=2618356 RepID=UPI0034402A67